MLYFQYHLHRVGGNPRNGHPRGSKKTQLWPKMTPNIDIMQKSYQLGNYITLSSHKNTFWLNFDAISTISIAYQLGGTLQMGTPGGQKPKF